MNEATQSFHFEANGPTQRSGSSSPAQGGRVTNKEPDCMIQEDDEQDDDYTENARSRLDIK